MSTLIWLERSYGCSSRLIRGFVGKSISDLVDQRLETKDILQKLAFVSLVVRHPAGLVQLEESEEINRDPFCPSICREISPARAQ